MKQHFKLLFVLQFCIISIKKSTAKSVCNQTQGEDPPNKDQWIGFSEYQSLISEVKENCMHKVDVKSETKLHKPINPENVFLRIFEVLQNDFEISCEARQQDIFQNPNYLNPIENFISKKFKINLNPFVKGAFYLTLLLTLKQYTNYKSKVKRNFVQWILYFFILRSAMANNDCDNLNSVFTVSDSGMLPGTQYQVLGSQARTDLSNIFRISGNTSYCQKSFTYTISVTSKPATAPNAQFITIDSGNEQLDYQRISQSMYNGVYLILVTCCQKNKNGINYCGSTTITLQVGNCIDSTDTITFARNTIPSQYYTLSDPISSVGINPGMNADFCRNPDIVVTMTVTKPAGAPDYNFIIYNLTDRKVYYGIQINPSYIGSYTISILMSITNAAGTVFKTKTFTIQVNTCLLSTDSFTVSPNSPTSDQSYNMSSSSTGSVTINEFSVGTSNFCYKKDIVYTMSITQQPAGASDISWITFDPSTRVVAWGPKTELGYDGTYVFTITGTVQTATIYTGINIFNLVVSPTCLLSTNSITISGTSPGAKTYQLGEVLASTTVTAFTENSIFCTPSDIVYSISVTSVPSGVTDVSWITFVSENRVITWVKAPDIGFIGDYTITIYGTITNANGEFTGSTNFVLTIAPTCATSIDVITITNGGSPGAKTYQLGEVLASTTVTAFTENSIYCTQSDILYSISLTSVPSGVTDISWITFDSATRIVTWVKAPAIGFIGDYTITIYGNLTNGNGVQSGSTNFVLTVTSATTTCSTSIENITITGTSSSNQTYQIGSPKQNLTVPQFTENSDYCDSSDILYTSSITSLATGLDNSFISFNNLTRTYDWFSTNFNQLGTYLIEITGSIRNFSDTVEFYLIVVNEQNIAPILMGVNSSFETKEFADIGDNGIINLGPIYDQDLQDTVTTTYTITSGSKYISFNTDTGDLTIDKSKITKLAQQQDTTYTIIITLTDNNQIEQGISVYTYNIFVPGTKVLIQNSTQPTQNNTKDKQDAKISINVESTVDEKELQQQSIPYWKSMSVSGTGEIKIQFSKKLNKVYNLTIFKEKSIGFEVKFIPDIRQDNPDKNKFKWNVTDFQPTYFTIQIYFENPLYISCHGKNNLDKMQVIAGEPLNFLTAFNKDFKTESIAPETSIIQFIPKQYASKNSQDKMASLTSTASGAAKALTASLSGLSIFLSASLNFLWGMINAIQVISMLPNFNNLQFPANAAAFFAFVADLGNLNLIPLDKVYGWLGMEQDEDQIDEPQSVKRILTSTVNSTNNATVAAQKDESVFKKMGPFFLAMIGMGLIFVFLLICMLLLKYSIFKSTMQRFVSMIYYKIFWNQTLRYLMESYMNLTFNAMLYVYANSDQLFSNPDNIKQSLFSIVSLAVYFIVPGIVSAYLILKIKLFRNDLFIKRFGGIMKTYNFRSNMSGIFFALFCYRRLIQVILIIFLENYPWAQVQLMCVNCQFVIIILGYNDIFRSSLDQFVEFFNECCIMICVYHCFCFTDFVDVETREYVGTSIIFFTLFNIAINMIVLIYMTTLMIQREYKIARKKYRFWRHKNNIVKKKKALAAQLEKNLQQQLEELDRPKSPDELTAQEFLELQRQKLREQQKYAAEFSDEDSDEEALREAKREKQRRKDARIQKRLTVPKKKTGHNLKIIKEAESDEEVSERSHKKSQTTQKQTEPDTSYKTKFLSYSNYDGSFNLVNQIKDLEEIEESPYQFGENIDQQRSQVTFGQKQQPVIYAKTKLNNFADQSKFLVQDISATSQRQLSILDEVYNQMKAVRDRQPFDFERYEELEK